MNVWILCNEDAGRGFSCEDLGRLVERAGHTVLSVAKQYDEGTPLPDDIDLVAAAGGDGTVATAAGVASKISAALALLPLGTANNIASSLGVSGSMTDLIASWTTARRVAFDLGCAHAGSKEWLVVEGIGGGLVPSGIARAQAERKARGEMAPPDEVAAALRAFSQALADLQPRPWTITFDGTAITDEFLLVEVLNIGSIGPNLVFGPDADPSDGYFDVVLAQERHRDELLAYLGHRAGGRETRLSLPTHRAREVVIASCADLHIDDERVDACELGDISIQMEPAIPVLL